MEFKQHVATGAIIVIEAGLATAGVPPALLISSGVLVLVGIYRRDLWQAMRRSIREGRHPKEIIDVTPRDQIHPSSTLATLQAMGASLGATRPELVLRYEPQPFHSLLTTDKAHSAPLRIQNGGQKTAREIRIDPIHMSGHRVEFRPPDSILATEPEREVQVVARHEET